MKAHTSVGEQSQQKTQHQHLGKTVAELSAVFVDNRSEAATLQRLQTIADDNPRNVQLKSMQAMMEDSTKIQQFASAHVPLKAATEPPHRVTQRQLASGRYQLKNTFFNTNLRNDNAKKTVSAELVPGTEVMVIPKGVRVSNFKGRFVKNEHSWVQTPNDGQGWIEDSMLIKEIFDVAPDQGSFLDNVNNRPNYLGELENHINLGSTLNPTTNNLTVSNARLQEAAVHLNQGQQAQTRYMASALLANPNPNIYDGSIANHNVKNTLWNQLHPNLNAALNSKGVAMNSNVKLKAKTALGQIIATPTGFDVMNQVNQLSTALGIPINYVEDETMTSFNLMATATHGGVNNDILQSITVTLPPDHLFTDAQSFKRISDANAMGNSDMTQMGTRISVSPVDTDLLHEFTHVLHYLTFENRRQNAAANHGNDIASYRVQTGGASILRDQDKTSEARTIHRNQSFADLATITGAMRNNVPPATQEQDDAFIHLAAITNTILTENDYRSDLGLGARQDHRAMTMTDAGVYQQGLASADEAILSV